MEFKNKRVIVTGGAGGLGRPLCLAFAKAGAHVAIIGRNTEGSGEVIEQIQACERDGHFAHCDFNEPDDAARAVDQAADQLGGLDVLVNNAALALRRGLEDATADDWTAMLNVNVVAPYFAARAAAQAFPKDGGVIVNISSEMGRLASGQSMLYATTKAALLHLNACLSVALAPDGIRVVAVAPGPFRTPMLESSIKQSGAALEDGLKSYADRIPIGRLADAAEIADAILFAASERAGFMTGAVLHMDGGTTVPRV